MEDVFWTLNPGLCLQHSDPGQRGGSVPVQGQPGDQAGSVHPGDHGASGERAAAAGGQAEHPRHRGPGADGQILPGAADHDGAERRRREGPNVCLQPQAEETSPEGHPGVQQVMP